MCACDGGPAMHRSAVCSIGYCSVHLQRTCRRHARIMQAGREGGARRCASLQQGCVQTMRRCAIHSGHSYSWYLPTCNRHPAASLCHCQSVGNGSTRLLPAGLGRRGEAQWHAVLTVAAIVSGRKCQGTQGVLSPAPPHYYGMLQTPSILSTLSTLHPLSYPSRWQPRWWCPD